VRRDLPITFLGALAILGHHNHPWLDRLNRALGGILLVAGVVPGISALWAWIDQKNEATGLLRSALDSCADRLTKTKGQHRQDLILAAHTTIVLTAYFDTLRTHLGDRYDAAAISKKEKIAVSVGIDGDPSDSFVETLYKSRVPTPSAVHGFEGTTEFIAEWVLRQHASVVKFLQGLRLHVSDLANRRFDQDVVARYRSLYLSLAAEVPEFAVWAELTEHSATQTALARLTELVGGNVRAAPGMWASVDAANQAEMDLPIADATEYALVFPLCRDIFQVPRHRYAVAQPNANPANEHWWESQTVHDDLPLLFARHFTTPESTERPLLLLGHPGAGKSLLMKALAANLPAENYTVVRVPLRAVDADLPIVGQLQQALDQATHGRVTWTTLVDEQHDMIRVVLLDGLDELLQASSHDRSGYLAQVAEFQRVEAAMGYPVAVVVTSRTLVAERVTIPKNTVIVKLEPFDRRQIESWLAVWNKANADSGIRPTTVDTALVLPELARQPLLLMMLAVYCADAGVPVPTKDMSLLDLYERLFMLFARREVAKQWPADHDHDHAARAHLRRLSVAALGMMNRGAQHITEVDLTADLTALEEDVRSGERLLAEFFFIHASEAVVGAVARSYEFLHATFAEYLVADRVVEVLGDVARRVHAVRGPDKPDDSLLFALLSHQPLSIQRPSMDFIAALLARLPDLERAQVVDILDRLLEAYHRRTPATRYQNYAPTPVNAVRQLAAYTANLVLLRALAVPDGLPVGQLWSWLSIVKLWDAGLDQSSLDSLLTTLRNDGARVVVSDIPLLNVDTEFTIARLIGDSRTEARLRIGMAVWDGVTFVLNDAASEPAAEWEAATRAQLLAMQAGHPESIPPTSPHAMPSDCPRDIVELAERVAIAECGNWTPEFTAQFLLWLATIQPELDPLVCLVADRQQQISVRYERPAIAEYVDEALNQLHVGSQPDDIKIVEHTLRMLLRHWKKKELPISPDHPFAAPS
jgi:GTPase SAR1 family protein